MRQLHESTHGNFGDLGMRHQFWCFFFLQLIRTSYVTVISSQFLFLPSVFLFRFNIVF